MASLVYLLFNPLNANVTKWSYTLKQFVGKTRRIFLSVFDHFVRLALKGWRRGKPWFVLVLAGSYKPRSSSQITIVTKNTFI